MPLRPLNWACPLAFHVKANVVVLVARGKACKSISSACLPRPPCPLLTPHTSHSFERSLQNARLNVCNVYPAPIQYTHQHPPAAAMTYWCTSCIIDVENVLMLLLVEAKGAWEESNRKRKIRLRPRLLLLLVTVQFYWILFISPFSCVKGLRNRLKHNSDCWKYAQSSAHGSSSA